MTTFATRAAERQALYPHVSELMWADGYRYALVLTHRYVSKRPAWIDAGGFETAALAGLVYAARKYNPHRAAWSTLLDLCIKHRLYREYRCQINWHQGVPAHSRHTTPMDYPLSLDHYLSDEAGTRLGDRLPDERFNPARMALEDAADFGPEWEAKLSALNPTEANVLRWRFADEETMGEIGVRLGCSKQAVGARVGRGLKHLREAR